MGRRSNAFLPWSEHNIGRYVAKMASSAVLRFAPANEIDNIGTTALKCDLRSDGLTVRKMKERGFDGPITYEEGLEVAKRIRASRYLGMFLVARTSQLYL